MEAIHSVITEVAVVDEQIAGLIVLACRSYETNGQFSDSVPIIPLSMASSEDCVIYVQQGK